MAQSHCRSSVTFSFTCSGGEGEGLSPSVGLRDTMTLLGKKVLKGLKILPVLRWLGKFSKYCL